MRRTLRLIKHYLYMCCGGRKKYVVFSCVMLAFLVYVPALFNTRRTRPTRHDSIHFDTLGAQDEKAYQELLHMYFSDAREPQEQYSRKLHSNDSKSACVHPKLDPYNPSMMKHFFKVPKLECSAEENWVYVNNSTFYISQSAHVRHGKITCDVYPLFRKDDFTTSEGDVISDVKNGTLLEFDYIRVDCWSSSGDRHASREALVPYKQKLAHRRPRLKGNALDLNVLMVGIDSVSRMTAIRELPKSRDYFLNVLKGFELEDYNIVGDATRGALFPILTGKAPEELPEIRKGYGHATTADEFPLIWKDYKTAGYLTLWAEDEHALGTFHMGSMGFRDQPTDFYLRPFYIASDYFLEFKYGFIRSYIHWFLSLFMKEPPVNLPLCYGSKAKHQYFLDYIKGIFTAYPTHRKFVFSVHAEISHGDNNHVQYLDEDVQQLFKFLHRHDYLNDTLLIFFADHGSRFEIHRATVQGKQEERMPLFALRFPPWFEKVHAKLARNVKRNAHVLTTPFDIHETLKDILSLPEGGIGDISKRGISLFQKIPKQRTCAHAGVAIHWCACLNWKPVYESSPILVRVLHTIIRKLNNLTSGYRMICSRLGLKQVLEILKYSPNVKMSNFEHVASETVVFYQVTIVTSPGDGRYETTVRHDLDGDTVTLDERDISRTNKYGSQAKCVATQAPGLRKYCLCRKHFGKLASP